MPRDLSRAIATLEKPVLESLLLGVALGAATVLGVAGYALWRAKRFDAWAAKVHAPYVSESIVRHGYAVAGETGNALALAGLVLVGGATAAALDAGGVLVLTAQRLLFVPHGGRSFRAPLDVPLSEIVGVGPGYGFSGNTIRVETRAQVALHFKLDDREAWMAALPGARLPAPGAAPLPR